MAQPQQHDDEYTHVVPASLYIGIWAALMVGTLITVLASFAELGPFNIVVALLIATIKGTLVVLFFMHLWDMGGVNRMVFVVSVLFLVVLLLGVFGDLMVRLPVSLPNGGPIGDHGGAAAVHPE